jgi:signal peptidase
MTKKHSRIERLGTPLRTAVNVVAILLILAAVVPFVIYSVPQVVGGDQSYVVLTGSMEPAISTGDVVVVQRVNPASVAVGDVIVFERAGRNVPTTHRVVERTTTSTGELGFVTKGDANEDPDSGVAAGSSLVGRVMLTIPFIGYVIEFANSSQGFIVLVLLPFGLLILNEIWTMVAALRTDEDESGTTRVTESAEMAAGGAEDAPVTAGFTEDDEDGFTLTRNGTTLGIGVSLVLVLYSALVFALVYTGDLSRRQFVIIATMALVAAVGLTGFLFKLRLSMPADEPIASVLTDRIVAGTLTPDVADRSLVRVDSLATLTAMADENDVWVVENGDSYFLVDEAAIYVYTGDEESVWAIAAQSESDLADDGEERPDEETETSADASAAARPAEDDGEEPVERTSEDGDGFGPVVDRPRTKGGAFFDEPAPGSDGDD